MALAASSTFSVATISLNDLSVGLSGVSRLFSNWYVCGPQLLSRIARFLFASLTSLAMNYCSSLSECTSSPLLSGQSTQYFHRLLPFVLPFVANCSVLPAELLSK